MMEVKRPSWGNDSMNTYKPAFVDDVTKHLSVQISLIFAYSLIILLGLVGNTLVIYMIILYRNMRTVTNFFIANLALADLMMDTVCLPFTLVTRCWTNGNLEAVMCHMVPYSQALSVHVSILTLTVIASRALQVYRLPPWPAPQQVHQLHHHRPDLGICCHTGWPAGYFPRVSPCGNPIH